MIRRRLAPAKVNLFLHVGAAEANGYHPLVSLMTFADVGDDLRIEPARELSLAIEGPFAEGLSAGEDNLVMRACRALLSRAGRDDAPWRLILDKQLPIAAGLGGGTSDAGAALRLLDAAMGLKPGEGVLTAIAEHLGADGPACLKASPALAEGRGERLSPAPDWPALPAVLVNPGAPSSTQAVYRQFDVMGASSALSRPPLDLAASVEEVVEQLLPLRNDLSAPAIALQPAIGRVIEALNAAPETLLARVSGSGATCFALCADADAATALRGRLATENPSWWVRACTLG